MRFFARFRLGRSKVEVDYCFVWYHELLCTRRERETIGVWSACWQKVDNFRVENSVWWAYKHGMRQWCIGNIEASQALAPGSTPGWRKLLLWYAFAVWRWIELQANKLLSFFGGCARKGAISYCSLSAFAETPPRADAEQNWLHPFGLTIQWHGSDSAKWGGKHLIAGCICKTESKQATQARERGW